MVVIMVMDSGVDLNLQMQIHKAVQSKSDELGLNGFHNQGLATPPNSDFGFEKTSFN